MLGKSGRPGKSGKVKLVKKLKNFNPANTPVAKKADNATVGIPYVDLTNSSASSSEKV